MLGFLGHLIDPVTLAAMAGAALLLALVQNGGRAFGYAIAALRPLAAARPDRDRDAARALVLQVDHLAALRGLACTDRVKTADPFLASAARHLANCDRIDQFESWAEREISDRAARHAAARAVWVSVADAAPALGMAGTIIGLIGMFAAMADPAAIGPSMALALLTTLYGVVIANLIAAPIAARLGDLSAREIAWQRELAHGMMVIARRETAPVRRAAIREVA
ncbi:MAG: flagellar motor protein [Sphingobium sp.]|nr:MAG: flagellar motor protein [Sphingobium sp.]